MSRSGRGDAEDGSEGDEPAPQLVERQALAELAHLYRATDRLLVDVTCDACGGCCQLRATGNVPYVLPLERRLILRRRRGSWPSERADGGCPLLDPEGRRCTVYPERPFGCRTWFCGRARGRVPVDAVRDLCARLVRVSESVDPGARPTPITGPSAE